MGFVGRTKPAAKRTIRENPPGTAAETHLGGKARSCVRRDAPFALIWVGLNADQNRLLHQGTIRGIVLVEGKFMNDVM